MNANEDLAIKQDPYIDEIKNKGLEKGAGTQDIDLYNYIMNCAKISMGYIKKREIWIDAEKYSKMYENRNWEALNLSRASHLSKVNLAIAMDVVETIKALITNRSPMPAVEPIFDMSMEIMQNVQKLQDAGNNAEAEEALEEAKKIASGYAENIEREFVAIWFRTKMQKITKVGCGESLKVGNFFMLSEYDAGINDIANMPISLEQLLPSPNVESIEAHKDEPLIIRYVMSMKKVERLYGIDPKAIKKAAIGDYSDEEHKFLDKKHGWAARIKASIKSLVDSDDAPTRKDAHVIVYVCYMPDNTEMEYDDAVLDDESQNTYEEWDTEKTKPITKKAIRKNYNSGSKRVAIIKDHKGYIIEDVENHTETGAPPLFGTTNFPQLGDMYGISEIAPIEDLIRRINTAISNIIDNLKMTGNPKLEISQSTKNTDGGPVTNEIGGIVVSAIPGGTRYVAPPSLGADVWRLLDWLKGYLDRQTKLSEAARGFNEFAGDSGRKIRELKMAARGGLQPKLDEQVNLSLDLFKHWLWIYQTLKEDVIMHKVDTIGGIDNYSKFETAAGRGFKFNISVSEDSILQDDPFTRIEMMFELYDRGMKRTGEPLVSAQMLIKYAPEIKERQTLIKNIDDMQMRSDLELQREEALKEYLKLVDKLLENLEAQKGTAGAFGAEVKVDPEEQAELEEQENLIVQAMADLVSEYYELLSSDATASLPDDVKEAMVKLVADAVMEKKLVLDEPKEQLKELEKGQK